MLLPCTCNEAGCQVAACNDRQTPAAEPSQAAQDAAVAKHAPCPLVERLHGSRILEQFNHMVHVWRDDILKGPAGLSQDIAHCFFHRSNIETIPEIINVPNPRHIHSHDANTLPY